MDGRIVRIDKCKDRETLLKIRQIQTDISIDR